MSDDTSVVEFGDPRIPLRLWRKIEVRDGCWLLPPGRQGYSQVCWRDRTRAGHRVFYEELVGPIPAERHLDHLCHTRAVDWCRGGDLCWHRRCVNPADLEPVTLDENLRRGNTFAGRNSNVIVCPKGHLYDDENTRIKVNRYGKTRRVCRKCTQLVSAEQRDEYDIRMEQFAISADQLADDDLVTIVQAAAMRDRSWSAGYEWVKTGKLTPVGSNEQGAMLFTVRDVRALKVMRRRPWHAA